MLVSALHTMILRRKRGDACGIDQKPNPRISDEGNTPIKLRAPNEVPGWVLRLDLSYLVTHVDAVERL